MKKTNAIRILDSNKIRYEIAEYDYDENELSAITLAQKIAVSIENVFKTLVLLGDKTGVIICIVPGNLEVELKKTAKISGNKSVAMVHQKDLFELTGYVRGGCSPLGLKKAFPIYIHQSCRLLSHIFISGGRRGLQIKLNPNDLIRITKAIVCDIASIN